MSTGQPSGSQPASQLVAAAVGSQSAVPSPSPVTPLADLVPKPPRGEPAECDQLSKKGAPRRSLAEMQLEMVNRGAFFINFDVPNTDPAGKPIPQTKEYKVRLCAIQGRGSHLGHKLVLITVVHVQQGVKDFKTMMEKGVLVTSDGCICPHEQYGVRDKGSTLRGHLRSAYFFTGVTPARMAKGKQQTERDNNGWPLDSQISHLCHRGWCVRPDHLQQELRVMSLRRNWCGILGGGGCDCGMTPPCVRMYHPTSWEEPGLAYCSNAQEVATVLSGMKEMFPFKLLDAKDVAKAARKSDNAAKRKRAGEKTAAKAAKVRRM